MPWAKRIMIKKKQYKQLYLFPLHYCSWFLAFRLSFPQSLAFWLPAKSVLKEFSFPSTSKPGLHICYLHCTDALLWTMTSLLPCLSPFFWPRSGAWFLPFSREDRLLPTTFPSISLSAQSFLEGLCPMLCSRVRMCSPLQVRELWLSKAGLCQTIFKALFVEAKCSFWIPHSMVITLSKGLRAFSVLSCCNTLSSDPWDPLR